MQTCALRLASSLDRLLDFDPGRGCKRINQKLLYIFVSRHKRLAFKLERNLQASCL